MSRWRNVRRWLLWWPLGLLLALSQHPTGNVRVKIAEQTAVVSMLTANFAHTVFGEAFELRGENVRAGALPVALSPTGERCGLQRGDVVDFVAVKCR